MYFIYYFNVTHTLIVPTGTDCVFNKEKKKSYEKFKFVQLNSTDHTFFLCTIQTFQLFNTILFYFKIILFCYRPTYTIKPKNIKLFFGLIVYFILLFY